MYNWKILNELLDNYGSAAYILNIDKFKENVKSFINSFHEIYPNTKLAYSYKTNYLPKLCIEADKLGMYAEVVSGMEYEIALQCGISQNRIIFNGPVKSRDELIKAFWGGATVNIDSFDELECISSILSEYTKLQIDIGLRCNLGFRYHDHPSRFGFSTENGDIKQAANMIHNIPNARLTGLHCHFSFDRSASSYSERASKMVDLSKQIFLNKPPKYIDLGGGFCGPMPPDLQKQLSIAPPVYADYANSIAPIFTKEYGTTEGPELILEPGVGLVGNVMQYACRVEAIKSQTDKNYVIVNGSVRHLKAGQDHLNHPISIYHSTSTKISNNEISVDIYGNTCMEHDLIYADYFGTINKNDIIVFSNVGAYSFVTASNFIRTIPPIVEFDNDTSTWRILKHQLSVSNLLKDFKI